MPRPLTPKEEEIADAWTDAAVAKNLARAAAIEAAAAAEAERLRSVAARKATLPWSPEIGQAICDAISEGGVLKEICRRDDMPTLKVVNRWLSERPSFAQALREAEGRRLFALEDELLIVARDARNDRAPGGAPDPTAVSRAKLVCDTLSRFLRAHYPQVWGDAVTIKQPESTDYAANLRKLPLEQLEQMRDNARLLEADQEVRELLAQKQALAELNRERRARGEVPLSLAKFLTQ